jgi:IS30 family transposase
MFRRERTPAEGEGQMSPSMPTRQPCTADEKKKLDDLLEAGKTVVEIAPVLQRTRQAIYARLQRRYRKRRKPSTRWPSAI